MLWFVWTVNPDSFTCRISSLQNIIRQYPGELERDIREEFKNATEPYFISYAKEPVEDMLADYIVKIDAKLAEIKQQSHLVKFMAETVIPALAAQKLRLANAKK